MSTIPDYMTVKHRECDDFFTEAESAVASQDWSIAEEKWQLFANELESHLQGEETILFPAFEQATGMTSGPTQVMRGEHEQMRAMVKDLSSALSAKNKDEYLGLSETLMILMQQHNMKEEMMLYPMSQQQIPNADAVMAQLKTHCNDQ